MTGIYYGDGSGLTGILSSGDLDNATIIRTSNTSWWQGLYDAVTSRWQLSNFTSAYDARDDRFDNENFTSRYDNRTDRFSNENFTTMYDNRTDRFRLENYSTEYASTGYKLVNFTLNYDARTDRWQLSNFTEAYANEYATTGYKEGNLSSDLSAGVAVNITTTTITADTITVTNLFVIGNISNVNVSNLNVNGSLYPAIDNLFDLGSGTLRWRNANLTGTLQAGTLSDGSGTTITGGVINAPIIQVNNQDVQVEAVAYKLSNFTSNYDARTDRFNNENFTTQYDARTDRFGLENYSTEYALTGYKKENLTIDYPDLDTNITDDWNFASNASLVLDNGTIIRTGNLSLIFLERNSSLWNNSGTDVILNDINANVGIGTTSPSSRLDVVGNVNVTGKLFVNASYSTNNHLSYDPIDDDLILYLPLSEDTSETSIQYDRSSAGFDGTVTGATCNSSTGIQGSGCSFDGTDDEISTSSSFSSQIVGSTAMTISGWVNPSSTPSAFDFLFGIRKSTGGTNSFYILRLDGTNTLECRFANANSFVDASPAPTITPETWQHVAFVYDENNIFCYVNGVVGGSAVASGSFHC